jgi:hypothetical protein
MNSGKLIIDNKPTLEVGVYSQITDTILMIEPAKFGYNAETAENNFFQVKPDNPADKIQAAALQEFRNMVQILRDNGIEVIVVQDTPEPVKPDAIFPNNWISFQKDNRVAMYPMFARNRRAERRIDVVEKVTGYGFNISQMVDYSVYESENRYLEGTGSMVFDRKNRIAYAALSPRTDAKLFAWFCNDFGYIPITFTAKQTVGNNRLPVYHTNVVMSVAENYVVICMESIDNTQEREMLNAVFQDTGKTIIEITENQMQHFAGNILQLKNKQNEKLLVMSQTAFDSLTDNQKQPLNNFNKIVPIPVPTIEKYGGGSVRCMMAEVF